METIQDEVRLLIDRLYLFDKPVNYHKELDDFSNKYWSIHGRKICINKLIDHYSEMLEQTKPECTIYPGKAYFFESTILNFESTLTGLKKALNNTINGI